MGLKHGIGLCIYKMNGKLVEKWIIMCQKIY